MNNEFLKANTKQAQELCGPMSACRELTVKDLLTRRADEHRREALRLENLAAQYPEGCMQSDAEATLRQLVSGGLYR